MPFDLLGLPSNKREFDTTIRCKVCGKFLDPIGEQNNALEHVSDEHGSELSQLIIERFFDFDIPEQEQPR